MLPFLNVPGHSPGRSVNKHKSISATSAPAPALGKGITARAIMLIQQIFNYL